ncbi:Amine oxidase [flavin-containing] [Pseudocercospora fuligena]|uniref:Amine oxidase n=1 Tax=Pseudocercospora fuligena TaxID=685502 RepID=A0A8H6R5V8_9PEZI|nr:Amine oxidase [flavin-containing] [Pseudocercospora fuligena]
MAPSVRILDLSDTSKAYFAPGTITAPATALLHVAGRVGATTAGYVPKDYESQIHLALLNIRKIIVTAGTTTSDIVKLTVYIVHYDPNNRKHPRHIQRFLRGHRPAMTLVPVPQLAHPDWLVEIDAVVACTPRPGSISRPLAPASGPEVLDVVVIGAGLAGLTAARDLSKNGLSNVVLEARDRVGGKTLSQKVASGGIIECGAGWINDTNQSRMFELVQRFGLETIEQNTTGNVAIQDTDGKISEFVYGDLPKFEQSIVDNIARIRDGAEEDCQVLDVFSPQDTNLDAMTFEAYLRSKHASDKAIWTATIWTRAMLGVDPRDLSALFFLNYCKSGGGLLQMRSDRKDGGQYLRIRQGTQSFSTGLAAELPQGTVRLQTPVSSVSQDDAGTVKVVSSKGDVYLARKVITTVPSPVLRTIEFTPELHPTKLAWSESAGYGYYSKAMMVFKSPFWIPKGFCGLAQSFTGPAAVIRDSCSPADKTAVLTCFMAGPPAQEWAQLPDAERKEKLLTQLGELFDSRDIVKQEFVEMVMYEWVNDEWSGYGCPCASLTPGLLNAVGSNALRTAQGNLHFAGTETAGEWKGYMEGAVRSGERAAQEVVKDLKAPVTARL